jgi:preprotein translocase subunit SecE
MAKVKKTKKPRKRKPKGKKLSASIGEREHKRASEEEAAREAALARAAELDAAEDGIAEDGIAEDGIAEDGDDAEGEEDELRSEPPPSYEGEDGDDDDSGAEHPEPFEDEADDGEDDEDDDEEASEEGDDEAPASGYGDDDEDDDEDDEELAAAAQMGHQRYVMAGFFALWIIVAYISGQALQMAWSNFASRDWFVEHLPQLAAIPHEGDLISRGSISLIVGGILAGLVVLRYYTRPDIRQWADEVAAELYQVQGPTRKVVGNNSVAVVVASAAITLFLTLLDRFWSFVTNLIYSSGA